MTTYQNQTFTYSPAQSSIIFNDAANQFLRDCKIRNLTKETIHRYKKGLKKFKQHLEDQELNLEMLTSNDLIYKIIPGMLNEGLALRTVNCNTSILKEFFKFLTGEGWFEANIASELKPFKVKQSLTHTFTDGHLQSLFAQPDRSTFTGYRNYLMMMVLLDTGIRLNIAMSESHACHVFEPLRTKF